MRERVPIPLDIFRGRRERKEAREGSEKLRNIDFSL